MDPDTSCARLHNPVARLRTHHIFANKVAVPRPNLTTISVYVTGEEAAWLQEAADLERRSLSNFMLWAALRRAEELGVEIGESKRPKRGRPPTL